MCKQHFNSVHCIIPPYMLNKLMGSGNQKVADLAVNSSFRSYRFRNDRAFFSKASPHARALLGVGALIAGPVKLSMTIYDCKNTTDFAGAKEVWTTGSKKKPTALAVKNAIKGGKASWDFYYELFKRNSIDGKGLHIREYVHFDRKLDNAYWDGRRMVFGDGDGEIFGNFTGDIDIIGHELTHGVIDSEANLDYENQAGALNESFADVFGIMIKQKYLKQDVKKSNWLIGEKVMKGTKYALRSMKAPGTGFLNHPELGDDPQPATMDEYIKLPNNADGDYGGVHYNSGIPNFAFYVAAYDIGGYSWEKAGRIWYAALTDTKFARNSKFSALKNLTIKHAEKMFGPGSKEAQAVKRGWKEAKV